MTEMTELEQWEVRCAELESIVEKCAKAFELIPVGALQAGKTWYPSEIAIHLLADAKEGINNYFFKHFSGRSL